MQTPTNTYVNDCAYVSTPPKFTWKSESTLFIGERKLSTHFLLLDKPPSIRSDKEMCSLSACCARFSYQSTWLRLLQMSKWWWQRELMTKRIYWLHVDDDIICCQWYWWCEERERKREISALMRAKLSMLSKSHCKIWKRVTALVLYNLFRLFTVCALTSYLTTSRCMSLFYNVITHNIT
jgi:hypothetical protein